MISLSSFMLLVILGSVDSSKYAGKVFSSKNGLKLNHLVVDKKHGFVFIGGVNRLYQLNDNLDLITSYKTGPENDSPECSIHGDCASNVTKILTNNYNKALVIDYSIKSLRLISCGSIFQGLCRVHGNINNISDLVHSVNQSVVANDETSSTVAFIGPGPSTRSSSSVLYVAATITYYDSPYRMEVPMIASRSLKATSMLHIVGENVDSSSKLMALPHSKYFVNYVYGFSSGFFTYFLTTQMKSDASSYVSKLVRICNEDSKYYSYTEIPIKCTSKKDSIDYNLAQAAFIIGKLKPEYCNLLGLNTNSSEDVLFVVFSESKTHENNEYTNPNEHSALCVYSLKDINKVFLENIKKCFTTGGYRGLKYISIEHHCANLSSDVIDDDFCKLDFDTQLEGDIPVQGTPMITYDTLVLTSIAAVPTDDQMITFFGTNQGHLKKVIVKNASTSIELDDIVIDNSSVNPDMLFDPKMVHLYAMTENKLFKIKIHECGKYRNCKSCLTSEDPQCGWCLLRNECTSKDTCVTITDNELSWIHPKNGRCSSIISVIPTIVQCKTSEQLKVNVDNFPINTSDQLQCVFTFSNKTLITNATRDNVLARCNTPEPNLLPSLKSGQQSYTIKLSLNSTNYPEFAFIKITFFNCEAFTSCTACISSPFPCNWCSSKHGCVYSAIQPSNVILSSANCDEQDGRPIEYCPVIKSTIDGKNEIIINNGTTKSIKFKTRIFAKYLKAENFSCRFSIEGRVINVNATLDRKDVLHCDEIEFGYSERKKNTTVNFDVLWGGWKTLDNLNNIRLVIYKCNEMSPNCGSCLTLEKKYQCGWCELINECEVYSRCKSGYRTSRWLYRNFTCPEPTISSIIPEYGLWNDQTIITIRGINLGINVDEVRDITVADLPCIQSNSSIYKLHTEIVCQINQTNATLENGLREGPVHVKVGKFAGSSKQRFAFVEPEIDKISPKLGPQSGGTELTIEGKYLDVGNFTQVLIDNIICKISSLTSSILKCRTGKSDNLRTGNMTIKFGRSETVHACGKFSYVDDPTIENCEELSLKGIPAGGINIHVRGKNLWSVQKPQFYVYNENKTKSYHGMCKVLNDSMNCSTPFMPDYLNSIIDPDKPKTLDCGFKMDNVDGLLSNSKCTNQTFLLYPNPTFNSFFGGGIKYYDPDRDKDLLVLISGENIDLACQRNDISVKIGKKDCKIESFKRDSLTCRLPDPNDIISRPQEVIVHAGYFQKNIGRLEKDPGIEWFIYIACSCVFVVLVTILIILSVSYKKSSRTTSNLRKIRKEMDELELVVAAESRAGFADLQTKITDLTTNITFGGIPFFEYRTYAMNVMFPNKDHSIILTQKLEHIGKEEGLRLFGQLINNKTFLLLFIRTLESNEDFCMNDRVNVASLIMLTLQNNMEYCTEIVKTLLTQLIENSMQSGTHPKLLLRQSGSVVEKMLSTWFTFLLYKFLKERAGEPLYKLFAAIKEYVSIGPVDAITCEARHALSEDKIIRQHIGEYNLMTVYVSVPPQTALITGLESVVEEVPVKVLDCDTVSQVKDKAIEVIYSNVRHSARPSPSELELEWLIDTSSEKFISDDDDSSKVEGEWRQKNTLKHYGISDNSVFNLVFTKNRSILYASTLSANPICKTRKSSTDTQKSKVLSTPLRKSNKSRSVSGQTKAVNYKPWHLIKPLDFINDCRNDKMISEIYLTRLLATKLILQKFVDDLFEAIFDANLKNNALLSSVKYMFDFLDGQALLHGITDPEVVHMWKSNCLPLRFWINIIKNPNFLFDVHKSNIVDSCLGVIAQAFMDSCSTSDQHLCEDSPTTKLLYAKDIPVYKKLVKQYYADVKSLPTISDQDMNVMLNEESHLHGSEFNINSSVYALYEYAVRYNDQLMISLKEDELMQNHKLVHKLGKVHNLIPLILNDS